MRFFHGLFALVAVANSLYVLLSRLLGRDGELRLDGLGLRNETVLSISGLDVLVFNVFPDRLTDE